MMVSINRLFLPVFLGDVEFEEARSRSNFGRIEVASFSIGDFRGVFQVVQNLFTGILNPSRSSRLGWSCKPLSDE